MDRTKVVDLVFNRNQLLYDIKNCAYVEGDVMPDDESHNKHNVQDIGEYGNVDRVTRILDIAHAECVEALFPYSKVEVDDRTLRSDTFQEKEDYIIHMMVPDEYSKTTIELMSKYIHEYIVDRALEDWLSITNEKASMNWKEKSLEMMEKVKELVNTRTGRVRRKLHPF